MPRFTDRYPLRITIVVVLLTLVFAALVTSGVVATAIMRGYLIGRVDTQLAEVTRDFAARPFKRQLAPGAGQGLPSAFVVQFFLADGSPARTGGGPFREPVRDDEQLPQPPGLTLQQVVARDNKPFDVPAVAGDEQFRAVAMPLQYGRGGYVLVAQSVGDVELTIQRLVGVQVAAGVILLVLLAGVGTYVVRRSLRGLEDVEHTALAIAGGDLSRRIPQRDPRTEVGRLSQALNQMLGQVETAFAMRTASERAARRSEELARRSEDAARRSEETARQSEEAARQSAEAARQSEDRMRRFVADASHELRTPLTSIRGFAELTRQRGSLDPETMRRIEEEARRMGLLVDDLLLLARLDQQRPLQLEPVDLLPIAADAVHDAQAIQPDRAITLTILPGSAAPVVHGDEARLRQVLGNLVGNALHHTPVDAPIEISVGTRHSAAVLEVRDTGPGLTEEQRSRVFERFYRADSARARSTGGSGLGLSIVAALVAAHRGRVEVAANDPAGAVFTVTLPLAED